MSTGKDFQLEIALRFKYGSKDTEEIEGLSLYFLRGIELFPASTGELYT